MSAKNTLVPDRDGPWGMAGDFSDQVRALQPEPYPCDKEGADDELRRVVAHLVTKCAPNNCDPEMWRKAETFAFGGSYLDGDKCGAVPYPGDKEGE